MHARRHEIGPKSVTPTLQALTLSRAGRNAASPERFVQTPLVGALEPNLEWLVDDVEQPQQV
jgi:hypothetical protein